MKIKANKTKLRAAIEARLTEKQNQHRLRYFIDYAKQGF